MANNSTISVTFKLNGDSKSFEALTRDAEGLKKALSEAAVEAEQLPTKFNFSALKKGLAGAATAVAAVGVAVAKLGSEAINLTQKWGDSWNIVTSQSRTAYETFIRDLSSGDGWDTLFQHMDEAVSKAKDIAMVMDELFERKISFSYQEAETQRYISEQQLIMRDQSRSSEERKRAAQNIIDAESHLADVKRTIWSDEARAQRDNFQIATRLNDEQTDFLVKQYNTNRDIINQARAYNEEMTRLSRRKTGAASSMGLTFAGTGGQGTIVSAQDAMAALRGSTSEEVKKVAELVKLYDRSNDALVESMAQAEIAVINIATDANRASLRATATLGTLQKRASTVASGLASSIQSYTEAVERAVEVNRIFGSGQNEELVRLDAMKSGLTALIRQYGMESDAVQKLLAAYKEMQGNFRAGAASKYGMGTPLETLPGINVGATTSSGGSLASTELKRVNDEAGRLKGTESVISSIAGAMGSLGQVVSSTAGSWIEWSANLLRAVAQAIPSLAALAAAHKAKARAALIDSAAEGASSVAGIPLVGPGMAVAAAATLMSGLMSVISSVPKFAKGGIISGPTIGLMGEYAGATNNPEVVAPLDKLRGMLFSGGATGTQRVELHAKGRDLYGVFELEKSIRNRG